MTSPDREPREVTSEWETWLLPLNGDGPEHVRRLVGHVDKEHIDETVRRCFGEDALDEKDDA